MSGQLALRDSEPFELEGPTTLSGTNTDGQLSSVVLSTPSVTTTRPVPQFNTTVTLTAAFSMTAPGTGTITEDGTLAVQLRLAVDLHIVVPILPGDHRCPASPVVVNLTSTAPYDVESGRVTLRAPNFSVPPIVGSPTCNGLLTEPVNEALAGAGHSLTLVMEGDITPPPEGEPTATTLAVTPVGGIRLGQEATLTASVVPSPAVPGAPAVTGTAAFFDGDTPLGSVPVAEDGTAVLTTTGLAAGPRQVRAEYSGAPPDWEPSTSAVVPFVVTADPFVATDLAGEVRVGGPGQDFGVTVTNTGFGGPLTGARLEVSLTRSRPSPIVGPGTGPIGPDGTTPRIVLSRVVDGTATPIPLTHSATLPARLSGEIGDAVTWVVPPGGERIEALRLSVAAGTDVGPLDVTFTLVVGEGDSRTVLGATTGVVTMVNATRQATTLTAGDPGFPPFLPETPPVTPIVRQGNVAMLGALRITPELAGVRPTGTLSVAIDGVPVLVQHNDAAYSAEANVWRDRVPVTANQIYLVKVPATMPIGVRQVTVRYSGDALFAPSQASFPFTVEPSVGTIYECIGQGFTSGTVTVNVEVQATVPPTWAAGQDIPLDRVEVRILGSRTIIHQEWLTGLFQGEQSQRVLRLGLGPAGTVVPADVARSNYEAMQTGDGLGPDSVAELTGGTGAVPVDHAPGTTVDVTLDEITITSAPGGFLGGMRCTPDADPYVLGPVTAAGTTLTVEPGEVVGAGRSVALTATALPASAGSVEFRDGTTTIGVVPVDSAGVARMATRTLPAGTRFLTARFFGGVVATSPSVPVELRVIGECPGFLDEGNGAVVRLVYLELLGRCPDAAGYAYWVDRLDGGTSPEVFARSIASTPEAVGRVVDDAYRTMLGRPADSAGRAFWTGRLLGHGRYDQLLADLGASPEFWSKAGSTDAGFVTRVYDRLLHRAPDAAGLDYWTGRLAGGTSPRVLVSTLANLDEPLGVLVKDSYGEILDRAPAVSERTEGITFLRATGDRSGLYAQLIGRPEFDDRAQTFPNPD